MKDIETVRKVNRNEGEGTSISNIVLALEKNGEVEIERMNDGFVVFYPVDHDKLFAKLLFERFTLRMVREMRRASDLRAGKKIFAKTGDARIVKVLKKMGFAFIGMNGGESVMVKGR